MSNHTTTSSTSHSSSTGRSWLTKQIPANETATFEPSHIQVVNIPNMNLRTNSAIAESPNLPVANHDTEANAEEVSAETLATAGTSTAMRTGLASVRAAITGSLPGDRQSEEVLVASLADRVSAGSQMMGQGVAGDVAKEGCVGFLGTLSKQQPELEPLLQQIMDRFPGDAPCVLLFAGSEENPHLPYTVAHTTLLLADRVEGNVLLIDSDLEGRHLTQWQGARKSNGVCDMLTRNCSWNESLLATGAESIDFLPVGAAAGFNVESASARLSETVAQMKSRYRVICVNVGDAHSRAAGIWSSHASGTYLVVSMTGSSQAIAKSAVSQLHKYGARLLGCVVSDNTLLRGGV